MSQARSFRSQLAALFLARVTLNAAQRIIYPFLPSIARGLGISLTAATRLVTLRMVPGLVAPFLGTVADRFGRRRTLETALVVFVGSGLILAVPGNLTGAAIAFLLCGLAKVLFDPSVYAFVGDAVPYHERGRAIGLLELNWSAAWLVGVPVAGILIERFGWRSPWMVLGVLGLLGLWLVHRILPPGDRTTPTANARWSAAALFASGRAVWRRPGVRGLLGISFLLSLAIEIPFIVYGAWLEDSFHLSLSRLGLASMVVGLAEGAAEAGSSQLTDRWGKRRSVLAGLLGLAAGLVALPWLARLGLVGALLGIAAVVLAFEFAIVSVLPLATELVPDARASLLSFNVMSNTTGRMLGSLAGGRLWEWQTTGIALNAFAGAGCALVAAVLLIRGLHDIDDS